MSPQEEGLLSNTGGINQEESTLSLKEGTQFRRITRERLLSTRYPSYEYILIANEGELERFQDVQS